MKTWLLDKNVLSVLSDWFANLSAGWFGSIFILPIFSDARPLLLLTVNLLAAIMTLLISILLSKRSAYE